MPVIDFLIAIRVIFFVDSCVISVYNKSIKRNTNETKRLN